MWFKSISKYFQTILLFSLKECCKKRRSNIRKKKEKKRRKRPNRILASHLAQHSYCLYLLCTATIAAEPRTPPARWDVRGCPPPVYKAPCNPSLASFPSFFFFRRHGRVLLVPPYLARSPRVALRSSRRPHVLCASMLVRASPPWTLTPSAPAAPPLSCKHRFHDCIRHIVSGRRRHQASRPRVRPACPC
jgi:hypothetical protein